MGSVSVSSCRCCMFVSCVHHVAVLNAAFCMTCYLLMLVEDAIGDHTEEAYSRTGLITALYVALSVSFCLPHPVAVSDFMICRGLCACTEMLWMCVLYVSFGSKVRPRTVGCVAMGRAVLFIGRSRLLVYSAESGVNRVQVFFLLDLARGCFVLSRQKLYVGMVVCITWLVCVHVIVMSSA